MIKKECKDCYFYKFINIGGKMYTWCFNTNYHGLIKNIQIAENCSQYDEFANILNLEPDFMPKSQKDQRNNKIKRKCRVFRYSYSINNKIASIVSRFSHWAIILSDNKEYLFHQNIAKNYEEEIESHDIYVLKHRYQASIREKVDIEIKENKNNSC